MITYTQLLNGEWIVRLQADNFGAGTLIWDSEPQGCESKARELALKFRDMFGWGKLTQLQRVNKIIELNQYDKQVQERKAAMERALRQAKQEKPKPSNNQELMLKEQNAAPGAENPEDSKTAQSSITCEQLPGGKWCVQMRARHGDECITWSSPAYQTETGARLKFAELWRETKWGQLHENQKFNVIQNKIALTNFGEYLSSFKTKTTETTKTEGNMKTKKRDTRYIHHYNGIFKVCFAITKNSHRYGFSKQFTSYEQALEWRDNNININEWESASRKKRREMINRCRLHRGEGGISPAIKPALSTSTAPSRRGFWTRLAERVLVAFRRSEKKITENKINPPRKRCLKKHPQLPVCVSVFINPNKDGWMVRFGNSNAGLSINLSWKGATEEEILRIAWAIIERVGWEWRCGDTEHNRRMVEKVRAIINEYKPVNYENRR